MSKKSTSDEKIKYDAIVKSGDAMQIAECEWNEGTSIGFTLMNTCIGVILVCDNKTLKGVHLPLRDSTDELLSTDNWDTIYNTLFNGLGTTKFYVVGNMKVWANNSIDALQYIYEKFEEIKLKGYGVEITEKSIMLQISEDGRAMYKTPDTDYSFFMNDGQ